MVKNIIFALVRKQILLNIKSQDKKKGLCINQRLRTLIVPVHLLPDFELLICFQAWATEDQKKKKKKILNNFPNIDPQVL